MKAGSRPVTARVSAARYRVYQFFRSILARQLSPADHDLIAATLPPGGRVVFYAMSRNDQRHSVTVCRALLDQGHRDPDLLAAALLHDSGKGGGRVPLWVRPPVVLLKALAPGALRWLAREEGPWYRRPFFHAWRHAEIGADLAAKAGLSPATVEIIRTHHDPNGPAAVLHAVDDAV
jgi:hypothetical protein